MPPTRFARLTLIAALYCTQNLSLGFFTYAFLTIAQARGVPLAAIGAATAVGILLTLKFLWAPVVDRFGSPRLGHYRGWLLATQSLLGLGIATLMLVDPAEDFSLILVIFAVLFIIAGTQDVAADAAATRLLLPSERGIGNGIQSAGSSVAQVVGGGLVLIIYQFAGWQSAAGFLALFSILPLPLIALWREDLTAADQPTPHVTLRSMLSFFARPGVLLWCFVLLPAYSFGFAVGYNLVRPMLVDAGWDESRIGAYVVIGSSVFGILAGVCGGAIVSRFGRRKAVIWLGALQVLATAATALIALGAVQPLVVLAVVGLANAAFGAAFAVIYTISMDLTRPESAGTDFTFFTTVGAIVMVIAGGGGIAAAGAFGFLPVIIAGAALSLIGLLVTVVLIGRVLPSAGYEAPASDQEAVPAG